MVLNLIKITVSALYYLGYYFLFKNNKTDRKLRIKKNEKLIKDSYKILNDIHKNLKTMEKNFEVTKNSNDLHNRTFLNSIVRNSDKYDKDINYRYIYYF